MSSFIVVNTESFVRRGRKPSGGEVHSVVGGKTEIGRFFACDASDAVKGVTVTK